MVLIRNCPPISKLKRFTFEKLLKSPEGELEARRAAAAMQATLDDNGLQPPVLPDWTPVAPRAAVRSPPNTFLHILLTLLQATPKYTPAEIEAMPFRTRRLLEVQGKIRLDEAPVSTASS